MCILEVQESSCELSSQPYVTACNDVSICSRTKSLHMKKDPHHVSMQGIFSEVAIEIAIRWSTSNSEFKEPVVCGRKAIEQRLSRALATFSEIARGKAPKATKEEWETRLDKLLDISVCRCRIVLCGEDDAPCNVETCDAQAHCLCKCDSQLRLPKSSFGSKLNGKKKAVFCQCKSSSWMLRRQPS